MPNIHVYSIYFGALFTVNSSLKNFPVQVWFVSCGNGEQHCKTFFSLIIKFWKERKTIILFYSPVHPRCLLWPAELHISRSIFDYLSMYPRGFLYGNSNSWSHFESSFGGRMYTGALWWRIAQISWIKQTNNNKKTLHIRLQIQ